MFLIVILGIYFTAVQAYEYLEASFTTADAVYGSIFFIATEFHGRSSEVLISFFLLQHIQQECLHYNSVVSNPLNELWESTFLLKMSRWR